MMVGSGKRVIQPIVPPGDPAIQKIHRPVRSQSLSSAKKLKSTRPIPELSETSYLESNFSSPGEFVLDYCKKNNCSLIYEEICLGKRGPFFQDYVYTCKAKNVTGEGRGKKRSVSKQCAAAYFLKTLLTKQKRGKLSADLSPLDEKEKEVALMLMSEYIDFEKDLEKLSEAVEHRMPNYTPLVNTQGRYYRCKALGFNAVGHGNTKEIAKRMAAKLILDLHRDFIDKKKDDARMIKELTITSKKSQ